MSKRCELQKEYYQQHGNYKGKGKYNDQYVAWLEDKVLESRHTERKQPTDKWRYTTITNMVPQTFDIWNSHGVLVAKAVCESDAIRIVNAINLVEDSPSVTEPEPCDKCGIQNEDCMCEPEESGEVTMKCTCKYPHEQSDGYCGYCERTLH